MGKQKLNRMAEITEFSNVYEYEDFRDDPGLRGNWNERIFDTKQPIVVELACGKGEYTVNLAQIYPDKNFIGIDVKGPRIWRGAKIAQKENLSNVRFLRTYIDHLENFFDEEEISEIWITFPDPYIKKGNEKKRLTSPKFLETYRKVAKKDCTVHLKTDSPELFDYTLDIISAENLTTKRRVDDVHAEEANDKVLQILTHFEKNHLEKGRTIRFVSFSLF